MTALSSQKFWSPWSLKCWKVDQQSRQKIPKLWYVMLVFRVRVESYSGIRSQKEKKILDLRVSRGSWTGIRITVDDRRQKRKKKKMHPSAVPTILAKEICDLDFLLYPCLGRASSTHCWIRLMSHAKAGRIDEALNKRNRWESHRMCEQNSQHWLEAIEEYVCPNTVSFLEKIFILFWGEQLQVISPIL